MTHHSHWSDHAFEQALLEGTFPADLFTHEAHLRLAWLQVQRQSLEEAIAQTAVCIQQYVQHLGAEAKYHHTLTVSAVQVVAHFTQKASLGSFEAFLTHFPRLHTDFKALLLQHYSPTVLHAPEAQHRYHAPDLLAFS